MTQATTILLSRDAFRESVFARDGHRCVICRTAGVDRAAVDAHHIIERRLFSAPHQQGGYLLDNGASLCADHHLEAEMTTLSVEDVRAACGIADTVLPEHLYSDGEKAVYTKWGDPVLANGMRLRGELHDDESVQKILERGGVLGLYTHLVRFPRTYHEPRSPGMNGDDRAHAGLRHFEGRTVAITVKRDGANTTIYPTGDFHGRSPDAPPSPAQGPARAEAAAWQYDIPERWRVVAENLYRKHSIAYDDLPCYLLGFHVWADAWTDPETGVTLRNVCLPWSETLEMFELLGVEPVQTIYQGPFDQRIVDALRFDAERMEGWVMRDAGAIPYGRYPALVAKHVRADHNHLHGSRHARIVPNLKGAPATPAWHFDAKSLGGLAETVTAGGWIVR